jgi:glyoxylase-like metal-dependent hydrolase (beta-lactamase superfamily II)
MNPGRLRLGAFEVYVLRDGLLSVDAGDMFGVAPKTAWARAFPADGNNRISISLNSFLIRTADRLVLVDTGVGDSLDGRLRKSYGVRRDPGLAESLRQSGFKDNDVDVVINTHLHFDHCGGNTRRGVGGFVEPAFPRAEYIIQHGEWQTAQSPPRRERPNYRPATFRPIRERGRLRLVEGDASVCPGVDVILAPGHTRHHQCVKVESNNRVLVILGDLVPTSAHVPLSRVMSFDLDPLETRAVKKKIFEQGAAGSWLYGFGHDPVHPFGRVERPGQRFVFRPLAE